MSLEGPWGSLGGSLGGSLAEPRGSGTGPAPGAQKVPKVCNCRQKQAGGQTGRHETLPDFGTP